MNSQTISAGELIYEAEIQITGLVEYGVSMEALSSGEIAPPPEGARFDQPFNGSIQGPKLSGRISGTDYLYVRADGRRMAASSCTFMPLLKQTMDTTSRSLPMAYPIKKVAPRKHS
jgi:hypothetical protein